MRMARLRVVGLISGTSMDGVDAAVADLALVGDTILLTPLGAAIHPYPDRLHAGLLAALPPGVCSARKVCELDTGVGQAFCAAARTAMTEFGDGRADLVVSLGQTLYHWVDSRRALGTLQIGQPAWIAEATGLSVIADLRARDIAAGGQGAPLAPTLDGLWLRGVFDGPAAAVNLGGIANITVVTPDRPVIGYDTGPANALLDAACRRHIGKPYDTDATVADRGNVLVELLDALLADPYYAQPPPKSTGKEYFNDEYLQRFVRSPVDSADLLATLVELTAITVAEACAQHGVDHVVVSGGGVANPMLMRRLTARLHPTAVINSNQLGLPSDAKEAYLAALLGFLTWHGIGANTPGATGAEGIRLLGSITPGDRPLRLPEPTSTMPTRLIVTPASTKSAGDAIATR